MIRKLILTLALFSALALNTIAQTGPYVPTADNLAARKKFQDLKFGLFIHWGIYSIPGIVESWSINSEDATWIPRDSTQNYEDYKRWYFKRWGMGNVRKEDPLR